MNNYYELFNLKYDCKSKDIINSYNNNINKYYNIKYLSNEDIINIKKLKTGLYILLNDNLKKKYDILLFNNNELKNHQNKSCINNIVSSNDEIDINLDILFSSNNNNNIKFENNNNNNKFDNIKKKEIDFNTEFINNRIFQEIHDNNKANKSKKFEDLYITSNQCRKNNNC